MSEIKIKVELVFNEKELAAAIQTLINEAFIRALNDVNVVRK
jgi:hypothetical protein